VGKGKGGVGHQDNGRILTAYIFQVNTSKDADNVLFCSRYSWGKGKEDSGVTTKVIERVRAHYEVEDVEMGKVYRWCPARVVLECTCGEELTLSAFKITCPGCGADHGAIVHAAIVEEMLVARPADRGVYPWRYLQPYTPTRGA
jgi:hypothetical protein